MKKVCSILILVVCVIAMTLSFAGCAKTCEVTDVQYNIEALYSSTRIDYSFALKNLPKGTVEFNYTVTLASADGSLLYTKTYEETITVENDESKSTVSGYLYIYDEDVTNRSLIKQLAVGDVEVTNTMSNKENRLKPYSITIGVLAFAGAVTMVVLFAVGVCSKKRNQNFEQVQTENQEIDN